MIFYVNVCTFFCNIDNSGYDNDDDDDDGSNGNDNDDDDDGATNSSIRK